MALKNLTSNVYNHHQCKCISSVPIETINDVVDFKVGDSDDYECGTKSSNTRKDIALFDREEIQIGKLLGKGTFANVHEVSSIKLNHCHCLSSTLPSSLTTTEHKNKARQSISSRTTTMKKKGNKRYALKQIRKSILNSNDYADFAYAVATLAMEAVLLSSLDHENIIKIVGLPIDGTSALRKTKRHDSYFILMDQLSDTLCNKILFWDSLRQQQGGKQQHQRIGTNKTNNTEPTLDIKINFALQIAKALLYLHERRIIFRDLKPQNIGFKGESNIQLFDFGLCRKLPPAGIGGGGPLAENNNIEPDTTDDPCFHMSIVGTLRYIAPEVLLSSHYNVKADVYSWAMVFYEMISLTKPYLECDEESHEKLVCENGKRPKLQNLKLPEDIIKLLIRAWSQNISDRLTMKNIIQHLEAISSKMDHTTASNYNGSNNNRSGDNLMTEKMQQQQRNNKKECQRDEGIIRVTTRCNIFPFFRDRNIN